MSIKNYPIVIKTYSENIIKNFINFKMGPVYTEINGFEKCIYIIDENYPIEIENIYYPYFFLTTNDNIPITEYFQDYFLKPLDYSIIKKKLEIFIQKKMPHWSIIDENYTKSIKIIKNYFLEQLTHGINGLQTYCKLYKEKNVLYDNFYTHKNNLNLIKNVLLIENNNDNIVLYKDYLLDFIKQWDSGLEIVWPSNNPLSLIIFYYIIYKCVENRKDYLSKNYNKYIQLINDSFYNFEINTNINLSEYLGDPWVILKKNENVYIITIKTMNFYL
jgi:hypothetical protein